LIFAVCATASDCLERLVFEVTVMCGAGYKTLTYLLGNRIECERLQVFSA